MVLYIDRYGDFALNVRRRIYYNNNIGEEIKLKVIQLDSKGVPFYTNDKITLKNMRLKEAKLLDIYAKKDKLENFLDYILDNWKD